MRAMVFVGLLTAMVGSTEAQGPVPDACARLAPQLGLKLQPARGGATPEWRVNMLGGLGKALFGGTATVAFRLQPPEDASPARQAELADACSTVKGEVLCIASGPVTLSVSTKRGDAVTTLAAGERVRIGTRGTNIVCRGD